MIRKWLGISFAVALGAACLPVLADGGSSDGFPSSHNLNYYNLPGPDLASGDSAAPNGVIGSFQFISGSAFTPITSAQNVSYSGEGCSASNGFLTTNLTLPDGADVIGMRIFYQNDGTPSNLTTIRLTAYAGDGSHTTFITAIAGGNNGYESQYFAPTEPFSIDPFSHAYVLNASAPPGMSICGVRVQYSP